MPFDYHIDVGADPFKTFFNIRASYLLARLSIPRTANGVIGFAISEAECGLRAK